MKVGPQTKVAGDEFKLTLPGIEDCPVSCYVSVDEADLLIEPNVDFITFTAGPTTEEPGSFEILADTDTEYSGELNISLIIAGGSRRTKSSFTLTINQPGEEKIIEIDTSFID